VTRSNDEVLNTGAGKRPVSTGALPDNFVLHRARGKDSLISSAPRDSYEFPKSFDDDELEFDIDVPDDDDFDLE